MPKEERYFRTDAINQPVLNALCDFGNSVIDTFQPMVSDEALISHWKKHRDAMERVAGMAVRGEADFSYLTILPEHLKMLREAGIDRMFNGKYAVTIYPFPVLGRVDQIYFCGYRGYTKYLIFYAGNYLPTEMNGRLYMRPDLVPEMEKNEGIIRIGTNVVGSADRISTFRNESMARRLNDRWFIYR